MLLTKALQLVQSLGLNERAIRYLLTHADQFDGLNLKTLPVRDHNLRSRLSPQARWRQTTPCRKSRLFCKRGTRIQSLPVTQIKSRRTSSSFCAWPPMPASSAIWPAARTI